MFFIDYQAMLVHPDKTMGIEKPEEAFKKLQNFMKVVSYLFLIFLSECILSLSFYLSQVLLDSVKRKAYDDELRREELLNIFRRFQSTSQRVCMCILFPFLSGAFAILNLPQYIRHYVNLVQYLRGTDNEQKLPN